ncbi:Uncharacterised protein [uncultured archaeon]|nr:Uncharacterised protein [uncultured archaeon]
MKTDVCELDSDGFLHCPNPKAKIQLENRSSKGIKLVAKPTVFYVGGKKMFYEIGYLGVGNRGFALEEIDVDAGRGDYVTFAPNVKGVINWLAKERGVQAELSVADKKSLPQKEQYEKELWYLGVELAKPLPNPWTPADADRQEALRKRFREM